MTKTTKYQAAQHVEVAFEHSSPIHHMKGSHLGQGNLSKRGLPIFTLIMHAELQ